MKYGKLMPSGQYFISDAELLPILLSRKGIDYASTKEITIGSYGVYMVLPFKREFISKADLAKLLRAKKVDMGRYGIFVIY